MLGQSDLYWGNAPHLKDHLEESAGVARWIPHLLDMREVRGSCASLARVDSKDPLFTSSSRVEAMVHPPMGRVN